MRIGIDARFLTHPQAGGFKTYTQNLVAALSQADQDNEYRLYVDREPSAPLSYGPNFQVRVVAGTLPLVDMVWREQVGLPRRASCDRLDLFHATSLTAPLRLPCPAVVTIHDMLWRRDLPSHPALNKHAIMDWYYRHVPERAARTAGAVVTVSQSARDSIVRGLGLPPERVHVTHEAAGPRFRPVADADALARVRLKYDLPGPFLLAMGSADPRKNVAGLLRAYAALPPARQELCPLAVVWANPHLAPSLADLAATLGVGARLRFLQGVEDADLVLLYNAATLFVFPSHHEGFGLPLLEAMACGTPVVAADNSSLPEIAGDAALLIDSHDDAALTAALARALADPDLRADMAAKGRAQAARFSWARCARDTVAVYREVACGR
ncbi:MAG: glycosyltransferase family 4 protein [Armatimonadetes bacterium]|nr:glycosyltransferase family 4 protein [Armatimonadota bacterium]